MMTAQDYERAAQEYLESLPLEHFMEGTTQSIQREITLESTGIEIGFGTPDRGFSAHARAVPPSYKWQATSPPLRSSRGSCTRQRAPASGQRG